MSPLKIKTKIMNIKKYNKENYILAFLMHNFHNQ